MNSMRTVADIKAHSPADICRTLRSLYYAFVTSNPSRNDKYIRVGYVNGLVSVGMQVGIEPSEFVNKDDIELLRKWVSGATL